nr:hypothetical protein Iba_chr05bCG2020 [Ipomoea batatas]
MIGKKPRIVRDNKNLQMAFDFSRNFGKVASSKLEEDIISFKTIFIKVVKFHPNVQKHSCWSRDDQHRFTFIILNLKHHLLQFLKRNIQSHNDIKDSRGITPPRKCTGSDNSSCSTRRGFRILAMPK